MQSSEKTICFIGLGSNLNDPALQVQAALLKLSQISKTMLIATSRLYRSPPMGPQDQPDFINAVAMLRTELTALSLLAALQKIESELGRERIAHWGPRTIDLDLLLFGDIVMDTPQLQIPHPGLTQRDFVIKPLLEIAAHLVLPCGTALRDCVADATHVVGAVVIE
jgi:2-amino-4-hydroxy-6-hydroxymethyldihydropteridine diphosphokinase